MTSEQIKALEDKGWKRWQKNGHDRLYVSADVLGLECVYYNTGNIRRAFFRGDDISNSEARRLKGSRTCIDLKNNMLLSDSPRMAAAICDDLGIDYSYGDTCIKF